MPTGLVDMLPPLLSEPCADGLGADTELGGHLVRRDGVALLCHRTILLSQGEQLGTSSSPTTGCCSTALFIARQIYQGYWFDTASQAARKLAREAKHS